METHKEKLDTLWKFSKENPDALTDWEWNFVRKIHKCDVLSTQQCGMIDLMYNQYIE